MDRREMIERVLGKFLYILPPQDKDWIDYDTLADQAIVIECEVEHQSGGQKINQPWDATKVSTKRREEHTWWLIGHPLPEGKALVIILPLEEE